MLNYRAYLPPLIGKSVVILKLEVDEMKYNGQYGTVLEFDEDAKMFKVQLENNQTIDCEPCFLRQIGDVSMEAHTLLLSLRNDPKFWYIERAEEIWNVLKNDLNDVSWMEIQNWCVRVEAKYICRDMHLKLLKFVEFLLSKCTHVPSTVLLKIRMVGIVSRFKLKPAIEIKTILDECKERHWGMLPSVFMTIISCDAYTFSEKLKLYFQTKNFIDSKMYDNTVNIKAFYLNAAEFLCSRKVAYPEIITEIKYIMEKIKNEDNPQIDFLWADILLHEQKWEEALIYAIKYEKYFMTKFGRQPCDGFITLYYILCNCYYHLGNIKDAKICFQTLKKYAPVDPIMKKLKHGLDSYQSNKSSQIDEPPILYRHSKSLKKCSHHQCETIEEHKNQFLCCSQCEKVYYCSKKCQKRHWKSHHKHYCKK